MDSPAFVSACQKLGLDLSPDQLARFESYEEALYAANEVMNLTRVDRAECWLRHFVDSLLLSPFIPQGSEVLDIGTGPGFPSWPLANARPDLRVVGIDSSGKMLGFLASQPLENLWVHQVRAEEWGVIEELDVVTGRAVAPLPIQLEVSAQALRIGGFVIPMRTPNDDLRGVDLGPLGLRLDEIHEVPLPGTDVVRVFPIYKKVAATYPAYPRRWAEIKAKPLDKR